ncbi:hypothetical protein C8J56DRAFT_1062520 [Mycena floridula]|nr:hypothetical protein C8J56DRAFT_1062520 [Mycena floridula]
MATIFNYIRGLLIPPAAGNGMNSTINAPQLMSNTGLLPLLNTNGETIGFVATSGNTQPAISSTTTPLNPLSSKRKRSQVLGPMPLPPAPSSNSGPSKRKRARVLSPTPSPAPTPSDSEASSDSEEWHGIASNDNENRAPPVTAANWNCWPNHNFQLHVSYKELLHTNNLQEHWANRCSGGHEGKDNAPTWQGGKKSTWKCLGIMSCNNPSCDVVIRPATDGLHRENQLSNDCKCGSTLQYHDTCPANSEMRKWAGRATYIHYGTHNHPPPSHILHLSKDEKAQFRELVQQNPLLPARGLISGAQTEKPVDSISPLLLNPDRVRQERADALHGKSSSSDSFIPEFTVFAVSHPDLNISSQFGKETVILLQTDWMAQQTIADSEYPYPPELVDDPISGIVSDAAHQFWKVETDMLITSSSFSRHLQGWVLVLISYSNGASSKHYKFHFLVLFLMIAEQARLKGMTVTDEMLAAIVDFSQAQRKGFILAFIQFWLGQTSNTRSPAQLAKDAVKLIKGCTQHFRSGVTRVSRISGVIAPDQRDNFIHRSHALLNVDTPATLYEQQDEIVRLFPKTLPFFKWWLWKEIAMMLFKSVREMNPSLWNSLPDTTNAGESMNDQGQPINYGKLQRGKLKALLAGETHRQTAHRRKKSLLKVKYENDGRPPDKGSKLMKKAGQKTQQQKGKKPPPSDSESHPRHSSSPPPNSTVTIGLASTPWQNNSCWLDTGIHLLHMAIFPNASEFSHVMNTIGQPNPLFELASYLSHRQQLDLSQSATKPFEELKLLTKIHRDLRTFLNQSNFLLNTDLANDSFQPMFAWMDSMISFIDRHNSLSKSVPDMTAATYFRSWKMVFNTCSGDEDFTPGGFPPHARVPKRLKSESVWNLGSDATNSDVQKFKGNFQEYFAYHTYMLKHDAPQPCWYRLDQDSDLLCGGRSYRSDVYVSLPAVLSIEIGPALASSKPVTHWNFPKKITTREELSKDSHALTYDLMGRGFTNGSHYKGQYIGTMGPEQGKTFEYDGMKYNGHPIALLRAQSQIHGLDSSLKGLQLGYCTSHAVYHVRGGIPALKAFFHSQIASAHRMVQFDIQPVELGYLHYQVSRVPHHRWMRLPDDMRPWLRRPASSPYYDYRQISKTILSAISKFPDGSEPDLSSHSHLNSYSARSTYSPQPGSHSLPHSARSTHDSSQACSQSPLPNKSFTSDLASSEIGKFLTGSIPTITAAGNAFFATLGKRTVSHDGSIPDSKLPKIDGDMNSEPSAAEKRILRCHCGVMGEMGENEGHVTQCTGCTRWSHNPCQVTWQSWSDPEIPVPFYCDYCSSYHRQEERRLKRMKPRPFRKNKVHNIYVGDGALAFDGLYWYPCRRIHYFPAEGKDPASWIVVWWRGCQFRYSSPFTAGEYDRMPETSLQDHLWGNIEGRKNIRIHACDARVDDEEILADPQSTPFTEEIDDALDGSVNSLRWLLSDPTSIWLSNKDLHPVLKHSKPDANNIHTLPLSFGGITLSDRAQVINWFYHTIPGASDNIHRWIGASLPMAHALTLLLAHRHHHTFLSLPDCPDDDLAIVCFLRKKAWDMLTDPSLSVLQSVDVDLEAISDLEELMFTQSADAGEAGFYQWGKKAGAPQDNWDPYAGIPSEWTHPDAYGFL